MDSDLNKERFQNIYHMLLQMGNGNFMYRIQRSDEDDNLEILIVLMNMLAEEINGLISHKGYVNPHHTNRYLVQTTFILDANFVIKSFNSDVPFILGFTPEDLYHQNFSRVLSEKSLSLWNNIKGDLSQSLIHHSTFQLTFITKKKLLIPSFCSVSRLLQSNDILVSSITNIIEETDLPTTLVSSTNEVKPKGLYRLSDIQLIQEVYDYILNNLDKPLPNLKELSRIFGTNEYKLKYGFKYLFKTSIYKFYNTKRLKKAHLLIQQTTIQLKEISLMSGFNTYPNFSKAFKKQFGYSPNDIKRRT
ncbi:MAG: AraC family transcriptional regulator [Lutibacter sp.]|uniref:AraC family transcriptional regulator n=1 Tax=Lutibacter sp. TaxID=1925666 RepID=UPI00299D0DAA|nr:AraC family transcriptional regulator [Lutibacter sp.]MDX1829310.1 AraC family transcriptional regulator [Lutibacter sp.]